MSVTGCIAWTRISPKKRCVRSICGILSPISKERDTIYSRGEEHATPHALPNDLEGWG